LFGYIHRVVYNTPGGRNWMFPPPGVPESGENNRTKKTMDSVQKFMTYCS